LLVGKLYKHYNDYTEQNILDALDRAPITGHLIPKHYIEDDVTYETVDPETIEGLIEFTTAEDVYEVNQFSSLMRDVLDSLTPREKKVLKLRFGVDMTKEYSLEEVGSFMGITRERVRQIEAKALRKMRHPSRSKMLTGEYTTLWGMVCEPHPKLNDYAEWGALGYMYYSDAVEAWKKRVMAAGVRIEEIKEKLRKKGI